MDVDATRVILEKQFDGAWKYPAQAVLDIPPSILGRLLLSFHSLESERRSGIESVGLLDCQRKNLFFNRLGIKLVLFSPKGMRKLSSLLRCLVNKLICFVLCFFKSHTFPMQWLSIQMFIFFSKNKENSKENGIFFYLRVQEVWKQKMVLLI